MASQSTTDTETASTTGTDAERVDTAATETAAVSTASDTSSDTASPDATAQDAEQGTTTQDVPGPDPAADVDATATAGPTATARPAGVGVGAGALVAAGLGIASLTGTSLGDMLRSREELLGQIAAATGGRIDQIDALYGSPWHTVALVNGIVALLAVIVGAVLLGVPGRRPGTPTWVKVLALGGTLLGVLGLLVAAGMYIDLFAAVPTLPPMPSTGGMGGTGG